MSPAHKEGHAIGSSLEKALAVAKAAQEKKGFNLSLINVEKECTYTDLILVASASSERQAEAIAEAIVDELRRGHSARPLSREGHGGWILVDFGDVIAHVFVEESRAYYDLDRLWSSAPRIAIPPPMQLNDTHGALGAGRQSGTRV